MDTSSLLQQILAALVPVLLAALSWASVALASYIRAKVRNEYLRGALIRLEEAAITIVKETQQTTIDDLKAAAEDGKVSADELAEIKGKALARLKTYLGKKGIAEVERVFDADAVERLLESKIEAAVHDLRNGGVE